MRFTSAEESRRRAYSLGLGPEAVVESWFRLPARTSAIRFSIEGLPNARIALARCFVSWLGEFDTCDLFVSQFGIWPSSEDWNLYRRLRGSHDDSRELYEAPGHLFEATEKGELETYLALALQFGWGGHIVPDPMHTYLFLSHDGWLLVSNDSRSSVRKDLEEFEIEWETVDPGIRAGPRRN